tara:strand:- start:3719 stop:5314 length:1596 start_codon:yes stop_codon:yes gene_type:complete
MEVPIYSHLDNYIKTKSLRDKLEPPTCIKNTIKQHNNLKHMEDILFFTGLFVVLNIGIKTVYNLSTLSLKFISKNFITNYYKSKNFRKITNKVKKDIIKPDTDRLFELNKSSMEFKTIHNKYKDYLSSRDEQFVLDTAYENTFDIEFSKINSEFLSTTNLCTSRWYDIIMMQNDIINIIKSLTNCPDNYKGILSNSVHESNLTICLAYMKQHSHKYKPEIIASSSIHPSFHYICYLLNIKLICVNADRYSGKMLIKKVKSYINYKTICIIASAPSRSYGVVDNIAQLSDIAEKNCIGLHVDCLSDNFLLPFLRNDGKIVTDYDFNVSGITSLSTNITMEPTNMRSLFCVLCKNNILKNQQYTNFNIYGICAFESLNNKVDGDTIAYYWFYLQYYGINKFIEKANCIIKLKNILIKELLRIDHISIIGEPLVGRIAIKLQNIDIYDVYQNLINYNWNVDLLNNPDCLSFSIVDNFKDESDIEGFTSHLVNLNHKKIQANDSKLNIFGVRKIIKNINHSLLLGEAFMNVKSYI